MSICDPKDTILGETITIGNSYYSPGSTVGGITTIDTSNWNTSYTIGTGGTYSTSTVNSTPYTFSTQPSTVSIDTNGLTMKDGTDIVVGGKSLTKAIEQIEERLCILHPNPELEDRWEQLKSLRQQYIEMEKDLLEKEKVMEILKRK